MWYQSYKPCQGYHYYLTVSIPKLRSIEVFTMGGCDRAGVSEGIMCMCVCMCLENSFVGRFSRGSPIGILGSI